MLQSGVVDRRRRDLNSARPRQAVGDPSFQHGDLRGQQFFVRHLEIADMPDRPGQATLSRLAGDHDRTTFAALENARPRIEAQARLGVARTVTAETAFAQDGAESEFFLGPPRLGRDQAEHQCENRNSAGHQGLRWRAGEAPLEQNQPAMYTPRRPFFLRSSRRPDHIMSGNFLSPFGI